MEEWTYGLFFMSHVKHCQRICSMVCITFSVEKL